jgi:Flp pilus assembly protein TadD
VLRNIIITIIAVAVLSGCTTALEKADQATKKGDYQGAIIIYRSILEKKNLKAVEIADIHYNIAKCLDKLKKPEEAVEDYRQAVDLKPDDLKIYIAMADDLDMIGMSDETVAVLQKALILDAKNPHAESLLGTSYAKLGQYMNAKEMFIRASEHNPRDPENFLNLGLVYDVLGETDKAIASWEEANRLKPDYDLALQNLGAVYMRKGKFGEASKIYGRLSELRPAAVKFRNSLGIAYYNNGKYRDALASFRKVKELDPKFPGIDDSIRLSKRWVSKSRG